MYATIATFTMSCNVDNYSSCKSKLNGTVVCLPPLETCMVPSDKLKSSSHGVNFHLYLSLGVSGPSIWYIRSLQQQGLTSNSRDKGATKGNSNHAYCFEYFLDNPNQESVWSTTFSYLVICFFVRQSFTHITRIVKSAQETLFKWFVYVCLYTDVLILLRQIKHITTLVKIGECVVTLYMYVPIYSIMILILFNNKYCLYYLTN